MNKIEQVLESLYQSRKRIRLWFGDVESGRAWDEEYDVIGRVGKSGKNHFILLHNSRSTGGFSILKDCIVKIRTIERNRKVVVYEHPTFNKPLFKVVGNTVESNCGLHDEYVLYGRCRDEQSAIRLANFMNGKTDKK